MVEAMIKIAGSLFIGGIGLVLILLCTLLLVVLVKECREQMRKGG